MAVPSIIERTPQDIINAIVARYNGYTGNTLQPAQVEMLIIKAIAYELSLKLEQGNSAAVNNYISYSTAPVLDYLVELLGVTRLPASSALVTVEFTLVSGHGGVTIPSGTRVASVDGQAVFRTQQDLIVPATDLTATDVCISVTEGANFNGYVAGTITNILDPQAYLESATNTDTSSGGAAQEIDEALRVRARLASSTFGTAGARDAYIYYALTANPSIVDVHVPIVPAQPGTVVVYPLLEDGTVTPQTVLDQVAAALSPETVRPLCDTVVVAAPTPVDYTLVVELVIYENEDPIAIQAEVQTNLEAFVLALRQELGRDVMEDQITAICAPNGSGVYDVDLGLFTDIIIAENEYARCTSVSVTVTGTSAG